MAVGARSARGLPVVVMARQAAEPFVDAHGRAVVAGCPLPGRPAARGTGSTAPGAGPGSSSPRGRRFLHRGHGQEPHRNRLHLAAVDRTRARATQCSCSVAASAALMDCLGSAVARDRDRGRSARAGPPGATGPCDRSASPVRRCRLQSACRGSAGNRPSAAARGCASRRGRCFLYVARVRTRRPTPRTPERWQFSQRSSMAGMSASRIRGCSGTSPARCERHALRVVQVECQRPASTRRRGTRWQRDLACAPRRATTRTRAASHGSGCTSRHRRLRSRGSPRRNQQQRRQPSSSATIRSARLHLNCAPPSRRLAEVLCRRGRRCAMMVSTGLKPPLVTCTLPSTT